MLSFLKPTIYIQISPERLTLKNIKTGATISEVPEIAISATPKRVILAAGVQARLAAASSSECEVVNPFAHPRTMVSDFASAEQLIKYQLRRVLGQSFLAIAPRVVIHPLGDPAGGFTEVELRAFREMAMGAGASDVQVCTGKPLADHEVLSKWS